MPIYAYHCVACGNEFDLKQGFDAHTETPCPLCDDIARRRFVAPTVIYKGSGFYTTDYARRGGSSANAASTADSKPEAKPEAKTSGSKSETAPSSTGAD